VITALLIIVAVVALIFLAERFAGRRLDKMPEIAEAYFRNHKSISTIPLDTVFKKIGSPSEYDDWDWGRLNYTWRNKNHCLTIHTQDGQITGVYLMDPADTSRYGAVREVVWEQQEP
jgi:hypothetical protein